MLLAAIGGCQPGKKTTVRSVNPIFYDLVKEETTIDSEGNHVRVFHWRYEDGYMTTTREFVLRGENEIRRNSNPRPEPEERFSD